MFGKGTSLLKILGFKGKIVKNEDHFILKVVFRSS